MEPRNTNTGNTADQNISAQPSTQSSLGNRKGTTNTTGQTGSNDSTTTGTTGTRTHSGDRAG